MFCTDVLSEGLGRVRLKGLFTGLGGRGQRGLGYTGRETALKHHTELRRLAVKSVLSLGSCMEKCKWEYTIWQSCVKPQHICPYVSLLLTFTSSKVLFKLTFSPATYLCVNRPVSRCVVRWVCFVDPSVTAVSEGRLFEWCRGKEGCLAGLPQGPTGGDDGEITRPHLKLQESRGAINCQESAGSRCPLCRWGISCWWPATGPHRPGGKGACRVIS